MMRWMRTYRFLFGSVLLSLLFCVGCASKDFREPEVEGDTESHVARSFPRNFSDVWDAVIAALGEKKYAISVSKRDAGVVVTDWVSGKSDRLFSGYGDTRIPYTVRFKMALKMTPSRGGVRIIIRNDEQYMSDAISSGSDFNGSLYQWMNTPSSGIKENALLDSVAEQLAPAGSKGKK
jgi:uncharacterized lipoprotein